MSSGSTEGKLVSFFQSKMLDAMTKLLMFIMCGVVGYTIPRVIENDKRVEIVDVKMELALKNQEELLNKVEQALANQNAALIIQGQLQTVVNEIQKRQDRESNTRRDF